MKPQVGKNGVVSINYEEPIGHYTPYKEGAIDFPISQAYNEYYEETIYNRYPQHPPGREEKNVTENITVIKRIDDIKAQSINHQLKGIKEELNQHFQHHANLNRKPPSYNKEDDDYKRDYV